jgi:4-diphosphocytidyl-2-C-methyl-D-erythritol kinase
LCNDLEAVTAARYPVIEDVKRQLAALGAAGASMSGSGTAVFGLFKDASVAQQACRILESTRTWQIFVADLLV